MKPFSFFFFAFGVLFSSMFVWCQKHDTVLLKDFVFVEGGSFLMGCADCNEEERPVHQVSVGSFYMGRHEVTQSQWRSVMGNNPSDFRGCDDCPVEQVSWNDVQLFLDSLNQHSDRTYRLPTEAEWEFAARGGSKSPKNHPYAGSDNIDEVAWYKQNSEGKTHPVGQKTPNELGLYDMSGNVREWCSDWYDGRYYSKRPSVNPKGPDKGRYRVLKGGSWDYSANHSRVSIRNRYPPESRHNRHGFRLVYKDN